MGNLNYRFSGGQSLLKRSSIFLILIIFISFGGLVFMAISQESIKQSATKIRESVLPAGRLIENAKREIDLHIHELSLLASFNKTQRKELDTQQRALLRLSPSVQSLVKLHSSALFPQSLSELFKPWAQSVETYQIQILIFANFEDAINALSDLRSKTNILQRALDRELSLQLLSTTESSQELIYLASLALILSLLASVIFVSFLAKWLSPLKKLKNYLKDFSQNNNTPPPSFVSRGILSPPREVLSLTEVFRQHLMEFNQQKQALIQREEKLKDSDRSLNTLFAATSHLIRNNEQLLAELIKKERLASMSEMAAQLAHEIKNPLNSMSLKLELLKEDLSQDQQKVLTRVLDEIDRLDALTESHLIQTRGGLRGQWPLLVNETGESSPLVLFDEIKDLFKTQLKENNIVVSIQSNARIDDTLQIPKSILKSALINLFKNSIESFNNTTSQRFIELEYHKTKSSIRPWKLSIKDSGSGFPEDYKNSPFEIFRTSKNQGSGLGLVTTHKMLEAYGIRMEFDPIPQSPFKTIWNLSLASEPSLPLHDNLGVEGIEI